MPTALLYTTSTHTLSFGRYIRVYLCVYTRDNIFHKRLSSIIDYGNPAAKRNCNEVTFSLEEFPRQQTFEHLLLDRPVTEPRHADDANSNFQFI